MFKVENESIILFNSKPLKWYLCFRLSLRICIGDILETIKTKCHSIQAAWFKCQVLSPKATISNRLYYLRMSKF